MEVTGLKRPEVQKRRDVDTKPNSCGTTAPTGCCCPTTGPAVRLKDWGTIGRQTWFCGALWWNTGSGATREPAVYPHVPFESKVNAPLFFVTGHIITS